MNPSADFAKVAGIGSKTRASLEKAGISTVGDAVKFAKEKGNCALLEVLKVGPARSASVLRRTGLDVCPRCDARIRRKQLDQAYDRMVDGKECPFDREYTSAGLPVLKPDEAPVPLESPANPPFPYFGGKFRARKQIVEAMPPHTVYIEPFAGGANVLLAKPPSEKEVLNDLNKGIAQVYRAVKKRPDRWDLSPDRKKWEAIKRKPLGQRTGEEQAFFIANTFAGNGRNFYNRHRHRERDTADLHQRLKDAIVMDKDFAHVMKMFDSPGSLTYLTQVATAQATQ